MDFLSIEVLTLPYEKGIISLPEMHVGIVLDNFKSRLFKFLIDTIEWNKYIYLVPYIPPEINVNMPDYFASILLCEASTMLVASHHI